MKHAWRTLYLLTCIISTLHASQGSPADIIIFSYDRPLQLYALLESIQERVTGLGERYIVCRASDETFAEGYAQVARAFTQYHFLWQPKAGGEFKALTMNAFQQSPNPYLLFAVDDIIVTHPVDVRRCTELLAQTRAYCFHLRLGKNITSCYNGRCSDPLPILNEVSPEIYAWSLHSRTHPSDWCYPHTLDLAIYCKSDIQSDLMLLPYTNPNTMESLWSRQAGQEAGRLALCFATSCLVNLPLNRVQTTFANRTMNTYTPSELLILFLQGKKFDIAPFKGLTSHAVHVEIVPTLIERARA